MIKCHDCSPSEIQLPAGAKDRILNFGFATGMIQLLTIDLVQWLATSDIPRVWAVGKEDVNVGYWLARGEYEREVTYRVVHEKRFHDWAKNNETWWAFRAPTEDSVVLHKTYTEDEFRQLMVMYPQG